MFFIYFAYFCFKVGVMIAFTRDRLIHAVQELYGKDLPESLIQVSETRKEFEGEVTIICFPIAKFSSKNPIETAEEIGNFLTQSHPEYDSYNVVKGFLNLLFSNDFWQEQLVQIAKQEDFGRSAFSGKKYLIEFCSPNTNKPLHLGHIRNILLGDAVSRIREFSGDEVIRVQIINDRGIAICKSMLAWKLYANGVTPESENIKPDHFVGDYYVLFEKKFQEEYREWQANNIAGQWYEKDKKKDESREDFFKRNKNNYFNQYSDLGASARHMLLAWEKGEPEVIELWKQMNAWVYKGFDITYDLLNVYFDQLYFESKTYILGKEMVLEGLAKGLFYQEEDGSVWVDLSEYKLDKKILLRSDGTSVYITQDIGTAEQRYRDHGMDGMAYVVADEQNYHFKVLFALMKMLKKPFADRLYHLSYGMVDLPEGKMKSREGTVVDADDLIAEVKSEARKGIQERGNLSLLSAEEIDDIVDKVATAALKYFIVKVNPQKRMVFNPAESVDMQGQTGPYIQYSFVRIKGLLEKARKQDLNWHKGKYQVNVSSYERDLLVQLVQFPDLVAQAAQDYDPSALANYAYRLAKLYHKFWTEVPIFKSEGDVLAFRLSLSEATGKVVSRAMELIGIEMPQKM